MDRDGHCRNNLFSTLFCLFVSLSFVKEGNEACFNRCFPSPLLGSPNPSNFRQSVGVDSCSAFTNATTFSLHPNTQFTNHELLPSLQESFSMFIQAYPQYSMTNQADQIRRKYYHHLLEKACFDYTGHGLFSYYQIQTNPITSFEVSHMWANFTAQILHGGQESELEIMIRKRIMEFLNISEDDYFMIFTANQSSAFKLIAETYPFCSNRNLLPVYDHESEAVNTMIEASKKRGACVKLAKFAWPSLGILSSKLRKIMVSKSKRRNKGLFVFPFQSRMTGATYSYQWMNLAQENGWHVLLDACALGPKDMDTLGLSLFRPDFLICSFYKVFGENPSGFGCFFVKKSISSILSNSTTTSIGMVKLIPSTETFNNPEKYTISDAFTEKIHDDTHKNENFNAKDKQAQSSEIIELYDSIESSQSLTSVNERIEMIKCMGLDYADSLGLILISNRARFLINWLVNALMSLQHPSSTHDPSLVKIYGPKIKFNRGSSITFNVFDWKGEKIDPTLVQKLADRNNISISCGVLCRNLFMGEYGEDGKKKRNYSNLPVITAALGFLTNFDDIYRLWAFLAKFLDADFVEKERWRYVALNHKIVEA